MNGVSASVCLIAKALASAVFHSVWRLIKVTLGSDSDLWPWTEISLELWTYLADSRFHGPIYRQIHDENARECGEGGRDARYLGTWDGRYPEKKT